MKRFGSRPSSPPAPEPLPAVHRNTSAWSEPTPEQVARRAYELFLARGGVHGHADEDWLQAERELRLSR